MVRGPIRLAVWLLCAWIAAIVVVAALVFDARRNALSRAERSASAMAQVIEEHTARTSQSIGLTLAAIADAWRLSRPAARDPAFRALLRQRLTDLPYVRAIYVIGPDGWIMHDTDHPNTPAVSLADRDYFRAHHDEPALRSAVSAPVLSRTPGAGWFISVTQRIGSDARFEGIVVAAMHPAYFESLYGRMRHGQDELIALFHRNGVLVARHPPSPSDVGRSFTHLRMFTQLDAVPIGSYTLENGHLLPGPRMVSYRTIAGWPFVVHVSYSRDAVLAGWRRSALGAAIAMSALTLLLAGGIARDLHWARRRWAQRARREQAERLEAMGQLTGGIAHDFGNVLGVLANSLHLLEAGGSAEARAQALGMARRAVLRGREMTDRLLSFARRKPLELRPADLNSLVAEAHPLIAQAVSARIEVVLQLAPGLPLVLTDASQLEMAVLNLVVNARDALGGRGRIVLRTYADAGGAPCLAVEDDGPGMPEPVRRRAVEPFFSTKPQGSGLGLAQVYGFMHQIEGSMRIESKPGAGTRVHLCFARAPVRKAANALSA